MSLGSGSTARVTVLTPATGKRLRVVRVNVYQIAADGLHFLEVYYGTGVDIAANPAKVIDYVRISDLSQGQTHVGPGHRTYRRQERGPERAVHGGSDYRA